jgi:sensor histidine kinase YesM
MFAAFRSRYATFSERVLCSLSEIERHDVRAFDHWFYRERGWGWFVVIVGATTALAWIASKLPWNMTFGEAAVLFNTLVLALLWSALSAWFGYRRFHGKVFRFVVLTMTMVLAGAFVGGTVADFARGREPLAWLADQAKLRHLVMGALAFGFAYVVIVALIARMRNREYAATTARLEAEARQSELSRQLAESRLKLLQLQIEPHFLFNTLGSAQQLAEKKAPDAARLVADLVRFLRATIPSMKEESTTLANEAALVAAYLSIMQHRLGDRLAWGIEVPAALQPLKLPPGMLITLVENAIKHGIEPAIEGGRIDVGARVDDAATGRRVTIFVADTGAGLAPVPGQGLGLANIRERLLLLYGGAAALDLAQNEPCGVVARLSLPCDSLALPATG